MTTPVAVQGNCSSTTPQPDSAERISPEEFAKLKTAVDELRAQLSKHVAWHDAVKNWKAWKREGF